MVPPYDRPLRSRPKNLFSPLILKFRLRLCRFSSKYLLDTPSSSLLASLEISELSDTKKVSWPISCPTGSVGAEGGHIVHSHDHSIQGCVVNERRSKLTSERRVHCSMSSSKMQASNVHPPTSTEGTCL